MEYPTITIIDAAPPPKKDSPFKPDSTGFDEVIFHEIGHNWFYGILGFNEREYPFLDEGINTGNQLRYMLTEYKSLKSRYLGEIPFKRFQNYDYLYDFYFSSVLLSSFGAGIPVASSSTQMPPLAYGLEAYSKTAYLFYSLRVYLGEELYDDAMHHLFEKFAFKHPYPEDVKQAFEEATGKDLSWFFDGLINTTQVQDYKLAKVKNEKVITPDDTVIMPVFRIKQKGKLVAPVFPAKENTDGFTVTMIDDTIIKSKSLLPVSFYTSNFEQKPVKRYFLDNLFAEMPWHNNSYYPKKPFINFSFNEFDVL